MLFNVREKITVCNVVLRVVAPKKGILNPDMMPKTSSQCDSMEWKTTLPLL